MENKLHALALSMIDSLGPQRYRALVDFFGSAEAVFAAGRSDLMEVEKITPAIAAKILSKESLMLAEEELRKAAKNCVSIYTQDDEEYPLGLKNIPDAPIVIYVKGKLRKSDYFSVALVGSRRATAYGLSVAKKFSQELARLKITTVSGLARGIDTEVHKATLEAGGVTIAVLGNGLNRYYPPENRRLQDKIADSGAVISEFPLDTKPDPGSFPRRNRIISAISLATVVVEADETSGSLITAKSAGEQGKDVFAVPGSVYSKYSRGPHFLIRHGAKLAESANDIIDEISPLADWISRHNRAVSAPQEAIPEAFGEQEKKVLSILQSYTDGISIELLGNKSSIPLGALSECLLSLELKGVVRSLPGKQYIIVKDIHL